MPRFVAHLLVLSFSSGICLADEGEDQAKSFADIYASVCLKHLSNLETLREQLKPIPALPADKAAHFLAGKHR